MKINEIGIVGILLETILMTAAGGFAGSNLINIALGATAQGNKTSATNLTNVQTPFPKGNSLASMISNKNMQTTMTSNNITLGNPFYIEYDKIITLVLVPLTGGENATGVTFMGNGVVRGIGFTAIGRALVIPISNKVADIEGGLFLKSNDSTSNGNGNATLSFREISHMTATGMQGSGAAIFNPNATRNLSFLSNMVAIFIHNSNKDGTNVVKAWEWK